MMVGSHTPKWEGAIPPNGWVPHPHMGVSMGPIFKFNCIYKCSNKRG
jgi:hypothetical protein